MRLRSSDSTNLVKCQHGQMRSTSIGHLPIFVVKIAGTFFHRGHRGKHSIGRLIIKNSWNVLSKRLPPPSPPLHSMLVVWVQLGPWLRGRGRGSDLVLNVRASRPLNELKLCATCALAAHKGTTSQRISTMIVSILYRESIYSLLAHGDVLVFTSVTLDATALLERAATCGQLAPRESI